MLRLIIFLGILMCAFIGKTQDSIYTDTEFVRGEGYMLSSEKQDTNSTFYDYIGNAIVQLSNNDQVVIVDEFSRVIIK